MHSIPRLTQDEQAGCSLSHFVRRRRHVLHARAALFRGYAGRSSGWSRCRLRDVELSSPGIFLLPVIRELGVGWLLLNGGGLVDQVRRKETRE